MFHAAHSNDSERWRTVITIWILPYFDNLIEPVRSWFNHDYHIMHDDWPDTSHEKINSLIPSYSGDVEDNMNKTKSYDKIKELLGYKETLKIDSWLIYDKNEFQPVFLH